MLKFYSEFSDLSKNLLFKQIFRLKFAHFYLKNNETFEDTLY